MAWVVAFLTVLCIFLYFLYSSLQRYYEFPVNTIVEFKQQTEMDFPSVTLCNFNVANISYVQHQDEIIQKTLSLISQYPTYVNLSERSVQEMLSSISMPEQKYKGAHSLEETFLSCQYDEQNLTSLPCRFHKDLFVPKFTDFGVCYTFHPKSYIDKHGPIKVVRTGDVGGLSLRINVHQELYYIIQGDSVGMKVL